MNNLINCLLLHYLSMICTGMIAFYFKTNCYFGSLLSLSLWFVHKGLFINCVSWNHMQDISPWPGVQMKVSHFKRQVASHLAHGPERQPLYFINSLGVRHCPLISRLGRQPDSKWKHITAHLHVSWSAMTRVNVTGILVSTCISRYLAPPPPTPPLLRFVFRGRARVTGIYKCLLLWKATFVPDAGRRDEWDCLWLSEVNLPRFQKVFDVWLENKICLVQERGCVLVTFIKHLTRARFLISTPVSLYSKISKHWAE